MACPKDNSLIIVDCCYFAHKMLQRTNHFQLLMQKFPQNLAIPQFFCSHKNSNFIKSSKKITINNQIKFQKKMQKPYENTRISNLLGLFCLLKRIVKILCIILKIKYILTNINPWEIFKVMLFHICLVYVINFITFNF